MGVYYDTITSPVLVGNGLDIEADSIQDHGWNEVECEGLADLDFTDNIAFVEMMTELKGKVEEDAEKVGLHINADKTKQMAIKSCGKSQTLNVGNKNVVHGGG